MLTCVKCGKQFPILVRIDGTWRNLCGRRYCLQCSPFGQHNTRRIHEVAGQPAPHICEACGTPIRNVRNSRFCSNKCQHALGWRIMKVRIEEAGIVAGRGEGSPRPRVAKRYLLEIYGHVCVICGGREWQGHPMPLVLDHIDGNADNWAVANLRLICGNCDMQLPTYKSKNRGKGRAWRRARYAAGKSY